MFWLIGEVSVKKANASSKVQPSFLLLLHKVIITRYILRQHINSDNVNAIRT